MQRRALGRPGLGGIETTVLDDAPIRFLGRVLRHRIVIFSRDEPRRVRFESLIGRMADDVEIWAAPSTATCSRRSPRGAGRWSIR